MTERRLFVNTSEPLYDSESAEVENYITGTLKCSVASVSDENASYFIVTIGGEHASALDFGAYVEELEDKFDVTFSVVEDELL